MSDAFIGNDVAVLRCTCSPETGMAPCEYCVKLSNDEKKPRLFYWEEDMGAWTPADGLPLDAIIDATNMLHDQETMSVEFKRIDMTDAEFDAIPEGD